MFLVDTNVLLYAANQDVPEYVVCHKLLDQWRNGSLPWYTSWPILYEFLRVVTHPRVLSKPWSVKAAWDFTKAILAAPNLKVLVETERHADVTGEVLGMIPTLAGNVLHDTHTAVLMREHGIKQIYTRDTDFHRFKFLEVIDPLETSGS